MIKHCGSSLLVVEEVICLQWLLLTNNENNKPVSVKASS